MVLVQGSTVEKGPVVALIERHGQGPHLPGRARDERLEVDPQLHRGLPSRLVGPQVVEVVGEVRAEQKLGGQVAHRAGVLVLVDLRRLDPALEQPTPGGERGGHVQVVQRGLVALEWSLAGSPQPRFNRKIDRHRQSKKDSASTLSASNRPSGPQSSPRVRAARMP